MECANGNIMGWICRSHLTIFIRGETNKTGKMNKKADYQCVDRIQVYCILMGSGQANRIKPLKNIQKYAAI